MQLVFGHGALSFFLSSFFLSFFLSFYGAPRHMLQVIADIKREREKVMGSVPIKPSDALKKFDQHDRSSRSLGNTDRTGILSLSSRARGSAPERSEQQPQARLLICFPCNSPHEANA